MAEKNRVLFIDMMKGLSILWVVVFHLGEATPEWLRVSYRLPLFFFISGLFFRGKEFDVFFKNKIRSLIVPFIVFYLLSCVFRIIKYEFLGLSTEETDYWSLITQLKYIFYTSNDNINKPFEINTPLWFLIGLFNVQVCYYFISKYMNRRQIFLVSAFCYVLGNALLANNINGPFMLPSTMTFVFYYSCGVIWGRDFIALIEKNRGLLDRRFIVLFICFICINLISVEGYFMNHLLSNTAIFSFIYCVAVILDNSKSTRLSTILTYYGKNSLIILCTHAILFSVFTTIYDKVAANVSIEILDNIHVAALFKFLFVCLVSLPLFYIFNNYLYYFIGRKKI